MTLAFNSGLSCHTHSARPIQKKERPTRQPNIEELESRLAPATLVAPAGAGNAAAPPTVPSQLNFLWDYGEQVGNDQEAQHWQDLRAFIASNNITRLITFIKDPSTPSPSFFSADNRDPVNSFYGQARMLPQNVELEVFFTSLSFGTPPTDKAAQPNPASPFGNYTIPGYFSELPYYMRWTQQMIAAGVPITGVALDPEGSSAESPIADYQLLIDFMDYYRSSNPDLSNLRLGITLGFDSKNPTYGNLSAFPLSSDLRMPAVLPGNFPPLQQPGSAAPEWRPNDNRPLLDSVYIQAYDDSIPYIFTESTNPIQAGLDFLHLYRDEPYMPVNQGTISYATNSRTVTGVGTNFDSTLEGSPIGTNSGVAIGIVNTVTSPTSLELYGPPSTSGQNLPYFRVESPNKWIFPPTSTSVTDNIYFMFSFEFDAEHKFFGDNWTNEALTTFLTTVQTRGTTDLPIFAGMDPQSIEYNFGIYDYFFIQNRGGASDLTSTQRLTDHQRVVAKFYTSLLHRPAEPLGLGYWTYFLDQGASPAAVALEIMKSQEYRTNEVQALYRQLLHRPADPVGLFHSVAFLGIGGTAEQLGAILAGSHEYFATQGGGSNEGWIAIVYQQLLGRAADPGGAAFLKRSLAAGLSRQQAAAGIFASQEYQHNLVTGHYVTYLRRAPDAPGLASWVIALRNRAPRHHVLAGFLSSREFLSQVGNGA